MWKSVSFVGRWTTTAAFAGMSIAASVKPEDAVSNLAAWWQYVTTTDAPMWLRTAATDRAVFAVGAIGCVVSGYFAWRAGRPSPRAPVAEAAARGATQTNTSVHALKIEFGDGPPFEEIPDLPSGKRMRTVKVAVRNVGNGRLGGCALRVTRITPAPPGFEPPLPLNGRFALGEGEREYVDVADYVESDPSGFAKWPIRFCRAPSPGAYLSGPWGSLPVDGDRREYEITLEASAPDSKEARAHGRLRIDDRKRLRLEPI